MSKKHFEALAAALKSSRPVRRSYFADATYGLAIMQWKGDVESVARVCAMSSDHFDRERFFAACGFND